MIEVAIQEQDLYYPLWRFGQGQWWYCEQDGEPVCFVREAHAEAFLQAVCAHLLASGVVVARVPLVTRGGWRSWCKDPK